VTVPADLARLDGRDAILAAAGDHPYARYATVGEVTGYRSAAAVAWRFRSSVVALGDPLAALDLVRAVDLDAGAEWFHLPRLAPEHPADLQASLRDDWDYLVTRAAPPQDDTVTAVPLDPVHDPAVNALLDVAFPLSMARPGDGKVRRWYGVRENGDLIATAADRSRGGVGYIAGVAVHPAHRRRGLGSAVTAVLTRVLLDEFAAVALGVMADAADTRRIYERLGYGEALYRTSLRISQ
jgi:ribosomal protein S18 acetylase RimI-like enzyme